MAKPLKQKVETKTREPLAQEARKYKNAEEFVGEVKNKLSKIFNVEQKYANLGEANDRLTSEQLKFRDDYYKFFNTPKAKIKYKRGMNDSQQLTDIWNKVNKKK